MFYKNGVFTSLVLWGIKSGKEPMTLTTLNAVIKRFDAINSLLKTVQEGKPQISVWVVHEVEHDADTQSISLEDVEFNSCSIAQ